MARPDKAAAVAQLTEDFKTATATVLTEYRGLSVTSMKALRRSLGSDTKYAVVKNTLTKIAAKNAGVEISDDLLTGPSALAFIKGDPIDAAKSLKNFQKENPFLVIKGGIFEGKPVTTAEIMQLADLESREVLLSKLAGAMKGTMARPHVSSMLFASSSKPERQSLWLRLLKPHLLLQKPKLLLRPLLKPKLLKLKLTLLL